MFYIDGEGIVLVYLVLVWIIFRDELVVKLKMKFRNNIVVFLICSIVELLEMLFII